MGDCCISMPTMFSVPGGTPVGRGWRGISPAWLSGNSFSTERVPLGVRGAERPRKKREGRAQPGHGRRAAKPPKNTPSSGLIKFFCRSSEGDVNRSHFHIVDNMVIMTEKDHFTPAKHGTVEIFTDSLHFF